MDEHLFAYSRRAMRMEPDELRRSERVEQCRRSVVILPPGAPALNREEAVQLFAALIEALRARRESLRGAV